MKNNRQILLDLLDEIRREVESMTDDEVSDILCKKVEDEEEPIVDPNVLLDKILGLVRIDSLDRYAKWFEEEYKDKEFGCIAARELRAVDERFKKIETALAFYADPSNYFAIGFFPDRPCGDFINDFEETPLGFKPGKVARDILFSRK